MDLRRADERTLLDALGAGEPLALAEAYHRSVPAAHAVARRLLGGPAEVEDLLLAVYSDLWANPPAGGPLEGWVRRTTWTHGIERLRASQSAPASPSAAGLLPDLPAPDVRFLDAAERAIAELGDDERRALLLAHDKGVPTSSQEEGADQALSRALLALAGPDTSAADRAAMEEDACEDLPVLGDWCLGVLEPHHAGTVAEAIDSRAGCAAISRAVRRGRRRIEGLPATPDMGQRVLVTVLTGAFRPAASDLPAPDADQAVDGDVADPDDAVVAPDGLTPPIGQPAAGGVAEVAEDEMDPFAPPREGEELPEDTDDPFGESHVAGVTAVVDTADLPQSDDGDADAVAAAEDELASTGSWMPLPGDTTAELRLSDILSDDRDDDPFADLDDLGDLDAPLELTGDEPPPGRKDPYSALRGLDEGDPEPQGPMTAPFATAEDPPRPVVLPEDEGLVGGYEEGQVDEPAAAAGRGRMAALLAWILPILGGAALGILLAIQFVSR
ncbi:hypothetical protein BH23ACT9_BH23ACT9_15350 [soil metagenome]